jgi:hypothetical protein
MIDNLRLNTAAGALDAAPTANGPSESASDGQVNGEANGRLVNGRFAVGNKASRGNAFARRMAAHRRALLDAVTPDEWAQLFRKTYDQALTGDVAAQRLLYSYYIGRPVEVVNPDRLDLDELAMIRETPLPLDLIRGHCGRVEASVAVEKASETLALTRQELDDRVDRAANELKAELATLKARMDRLRGFSLDEDEDDEDVLLDDRDLGPENDPPPDGRPAA